MTIFDYIKMGIVLIFAIACFIYGAVTGLKTIFIKIPNVIFAKDSDDLDDFTPLAYCGRITGVIISLYLAWEIGVPLGSLFGKTVAEFILGL